MLLMGILFKYMFCSRKSKEEKIEDLLYRRARKERRGESSEEKHGVGALLNSDNSRSSSGPTHSCDPHHHCRWRLRPPQATQSYEYSCDVDLEGFRGV